MIIFYSTVEYFTRYIVYNFIQKINLNRLGNDIIICMNNNASYNSIIVIILILLMNYYFDTYSLPTW